MVEEHIIVLIVRKIVIVVNDLKEEMIKSDNPISTFIDNFRQIINFSSSNSIFQLFNNSKILKVIIENNLFFKNEDLLFHKLGEEQSIKCLNLMYDFDSNYVTRNIINIFYYFNSSYFYKTYLSFLKHYGISLTYIMNLLDANDIPVEQNYFARELLESTYNVNYIIDHIDYFLTDNNELLRLKKILMSYNIKLKYNDEINSYIDDNPDLILNEIARFNRSITSSAIEKEKYMPFLKQVVDELLEHENANYHDIEYLDSGFYSNVYKIGDKVLKIGSERKAFNISNSRYFLKPIYRQNVRSLDAKKVLFCIEITECVNTDNITEEDVYTVYKELRDQGLIWTDCKRSNLGRLKKDNRIYFDGITKVSKNSTGYLDDNNEVLKKGELVIIDNDYIFPENAFFDMYDEGDEDVSMMFDVFKKYENRYNREKMRKKF